jgi:hypothetical protein
VRQRRDGTHRELPLETEPDIDQHHGQGDDQRRNPVREQLFRHFRANGVVAQEIAVLNAQIKRLRQSLNDQLVGRAGCAFRFLLVSQRLEVIAKKVRRRFAEFHNNNLAPIRAAGAVDLGIDRHRGADGRHSDLIGLGQFHDRTAGEIDAEIEATRPQQEGGSGNQDHREQSPGDPHVHEGDVRPFGPVLDQHRVSPAPKFRTAWVSAVSYIRP